MKGILGREETALYLSRQINDSPIFVLLAGCTEVSKIPGITGAGANPDLTFLTPTLDSEIISEGRSLSSEIPPITPSGIPTPAIPSRAMNELAGIETMIVDAGLDVQPKTHYFYTGLKPARNPATEKALPRFEEAYQTGRKLGRLLSKHSLIIIAETIPGGTTTAQVVMSTYGDFKASSSLPLDPSELKMQIVNGALARQSHAIGNPLRIVEEYGDYTMAISLGIISSADTYILLSGGTQMANIYHLSSSLQRSALPYLITNRWLMKHRGETMRAIVPEGRLLVSGINFSEMMFPGLRAYESGIVKEGVGISAAFFSALATGKTQPEIYEAIGRYYETFRSHGSAGIIS
ncbi:nicotinate-nucleotide--dimethylbenzimidazole phosphoribosyltransferase [Thermoplasmatales archaeon AK]|nr:nicotinate-nucleotide--dimethylbenzimidazole phosphoribosyltransferase [Thermoplasmatales archaeon AK]